MAPQIAKEMISAASNAVLQNYAQSDEYRGYVLLQKGDIDGLVGMARQRAATLNVDKSQLEQELATFQKEFPEHQTYLRETEQSIRQNGFKEYFLRQDIKEKVMTGVIRYLLDNPDGTTSHCPFSEGRDLTWNYAFKQGINAVLTADQRTVLARLARENKRTNQTWREAEPIEKIYGIDYKLDGFIFNQLTDFVRHLYAREYQAKGKLL